MQYVDRGLDKVILHPPILIFFGGFGCTNLGNLVFLLIWIFYIIELTKKNAEISFSWIYNMQIISGVVILGCIDALPANRDLMGAEGPKHIPIF